MLLRQILSHKFNDQRYLFCVVYGVVVRCGTNPAPNVRLSIQSPEYLSVPCVSGRFPTKYIEEFMEERDNEK